MNGERTIRSALRTLLAALGTGLAAVLLLGLMAPAAQAAQPAGPGSSSLPRFSMPAVAMPGGPMTIEIHKYEQPRESGLPASGLPIADPSQLPGSPPVAGATFTATRVPGIDISTNAGQRAAAKLTAEQAARRIADADVPAAATATTDARGDATLSLTGRGLYYVQETGTPAGFSGAAPFLVMLPLTDPQSRDRWLTTVHVYPKNSKAGITLQVDDRDAVTLGAPVRWRSASDIPDREGIGGYTVRLSIDPALALSGERPFAVSLDCTGCAGLAAGSHYTLQQDPATEEWIFDFTAAGRAALAAAVAKHPDAQVVIDYVTEVLAVGALRSTASLSVDGSPAVSDTALTKWGPLAIQVHERGKPEHRIPGARFQLFLTAEDAALGRDPVVVGGASEWTTDADGGIVIDGLRFSNFANGLDLQPSDPGYREYYAIMTYIPPGYTGLMQPIALAVTSVTQAEVALVEIWPSADADSGSDADPDPDAGSDPHGGADANGSDTGSDAGGSDAKGDDIPVTGGQVAGAAMLGALLLFGGIAVLLRRRARDDEMRRRGA